MGAGASIEEAHALSGLSDDMLMRQFQEADTDQDGFVTADEMRHLLSVMASENWDDVDNTKSGSPMALDSTALPEKIGPLEFMHMVYEITLREQCTQILREAFESSPSKKIFPKEKALHMMERLAVLFRQFHCYDSEVDIYQAKFIQLYDMNEGEVGSLELRQLLNDFLLIFRFTRKCYREFHRRDTEHAGYLSPGLLESFINWSIDEYSFEHSSLSEEERRILRNEIWDMMNSLEDSKFEPYKIPLVVLKIFEGNRWMHIYTPQLPAEKDVIHPQKRLSHFTIRDWSEKDLLEVGIAPLAYAKFHELDIHKSGMIDPKQVLELIDWVFSTHNKVRQIDLTPAKYEAEKKNIINGFQSDLEHPLVLHSLRYF